MQYTYMGEMDAVTGESGVSSVVSDDCPLYHEIPGGGYYDPGFNAGQPMLDPPPPLAEDPNVAAALNNLQTAIDAGPGTMNMRDFYGIPWPWIAAGLVGIILLRS